jgi:hypothetical protein
MPDGPIAISSLITAPTKIPVNSVPVLVVVMNKIQSGRTGGGAKVALLQRTSLPQNKWYVDEVPIV